MLCQKLDHVTDSYFLCFLSQEKLRILPYHEAYAGDSSEKIGEIDYTLVLLLLLCWFEIMTALQKLSPLEKFIISF